jgi:hypothetical protein
LFGYTFLKGVSNYGQFVPIGLMRGVRPSGQQPYLVPAHPPIGLTGTGIGTGLIGCGCITVTCERNNITIKITTKIIIRILLVSIIHFYNKITYYKLCYYKSEK